MKMCYFLWTSIFGLFLTLSNAYEDQNLQHTFVPESHPNWNKLDHQSCGVSLKSRIIGGKSATLGQYPWIVRMGRLSVERNNTVVNYPCGGVILNKHYIVTAAHCFPKPMFYPNFASIGEYNLETDPDCMDGFCGPSIQNIPILECYVPKEFNLRNLINDIALCLLEKPIQFNELVSPICLQPFSLSSANITGQVTEVAGWGFIDIRTKAHPSILQTLRITIVENQQCEIYKRNHLNFVNTILCASGGKGHDSCRGDSGGPLMIESDVSGPRKYFLAGVVSYGPRDCGVSDLPAVYTKVAQFQSWLLDLIAMD